MRCLLSTLFIALQVTIGSAAYSQNSIHKIILKTGALPGDIDTAEAKNLNEPLRGLLALYSAMGGSYCQEETCGLTTALGLGKQGSDAHKALILKYFPDDKVAKAVVAQDCYLRPSGASTFSEYQYLTLSISKDTVKVNYKLYYYDHGVSEKTSGPDVYIFHDNKYKMLKRKLWSQYDR